jgi:hypothetical protein
MTLHKGLLTSRGRLPLCMALRMIARNITTPEQILFPLRERGVLLENPPFLRIFFPKLCREWISKLSESLNLFLAYLILCPAGSFLQTSTSLSP